MAPRSRSAKLAAVVLAPSFRSWSGLVLVAAAIACAPARNHGEQGESGGDPCADEDLPDCMTCPGELFALCGTACQADGLSCSTTIGDGLTCNEGRWTCEVHPPLGTGCNRVCNEIEVPAPICDVDPIVAFDTACVRDTDCALVFHQLDCCGSLAALGISTSDWARFNANEAACRTQQDACECAPMSTTTQDGASSEDFARLGAHCLAGQCRSRLIDDEP